MFFYLTKLIFCGFLHVEGQLKYCDVAPLNCLMMIWDLYDDDDVVFIWRIIHVNALMRLTMSEPEAELRRYHYRSNT